jgi:hypothetical protein
MRGGGHQGGVRVVGCSSAFHRAGGGAEATSH